MIDRNLDSWLKIEQGENSKSLTDQVYTCIKNEIYNKRWLEGEKLPSYTELLNSTKLSRSVFQTAFARLEKENFVEIQSKKGIYVKQGATHQIAIIGVIILACLKGEDQTENAMCENFGRLDLKNIKRLGFKNGYHVEVRFLSKRKLSFSKLDPNSTHKIKGVLSTVKKSLLFSSIQGIPKDLPITYLGVIDYLSYPRMTSCIRHNVFVMTTYLLKFGHREIGLLSHSNWGKELILEAWAGYCDALKEYSLKENQKMIDFIQGHHTIDHVLLKSYFAKFKGLTAIVNLQANLFNILIEYGQLMQINIPEDLSVISLQVEKSNQNQLKSTGTEFSWDSILNTCFDSFKKDFLETNNVENFMFQPEISKGNTVKKIS